MSTYEGEHWETNNNDVNNTGNSKFQHIFPENIQIIIISITLILRNIFRERMQETEAGDLNRKIHL